MTPQPPASEAVATSSRGTYFGALARLYPTVWHYRTRVVVSLGFVVAAKFANIGVPVLLKQLVDALGGRPASLTVPIALIAAYGLLRFSTSAFQELRGIVFARVMVNTSRLITLRAFGHMHRLSLRFHLDRETGGVTRDIERGMNSVTDLLDWTIYSILPSLLEMGVIVVILVTRYDWTFAAITIGTLAVYMAFTALATEWRTRFFREMTQADTEANARSVDSLLNYETVKYFNNEDHELERFDRSMKGLESAAIKSLKTASVLNLGQAAIIALGLTLLLWRASVAVVQGQMSVGDLVMVNAFLLQLAVPLNYLGMLYREIGQAVANLEGMFRLLEENIEVRDAPGAPILDVRGGCVSFDCVGFAYERGRRILHEVSFEIPAGRCVAVVGTTGSGKSTLGRLLYRFYDPESGGIRIDGQDLRDVTQDSVRRAIGVVPQDTVLFNDTIRYNIAYGRPGANPDEVVAAARSAHIHDFIQSLPSGYDTRVGERGLKLSGGEKQRVAIARMLLKRPTVMVFDEATSALDSGTEKVIQAELEDIARGRTTLIIAHRLSTVVHADEILVLEKGRIVERGSHAGLIARRGRYATLWSMQQGMQREPETCA